MNRLLLALTFSTLTVLAQPQGPFQQNGQADNSPQDDPPSRVARLNWLTGDVAFQPATVDTWTNATLNYPLTTGDHLFVNPGGRAELHVGGTAIRLNSNSNFGFLNLDDSIVQMSLTEGSVEIRLRQLDQNDTFEIDTPNGALTLLRAGEYRVDTNADRNVTVVTVYSGQAEMYQDGNSLLITARQSAQFRDGEGPQVGGQYPRDDFDTFTSARNNAEDALPRGEYVQDSMIGAEDLYAYGRWDTDPLYGPVWMPPVDPGWSPYSQGRWAFVEPWGWTWVDEAPWGFAPFHYGRWAMVRGGWAWIPGARTYRPVYAPALVGFVGGGGFGVSIGWFPLGPREPWVPAWGASRGYINRVNVMHVTNINVVNVTNINYVNRTRVTVVSQADFAGARPVRSSAIQVSPGQIRDAQMIGYGPRIAPVRGSVVIGTSRVAPRIAERAVVAHTPPPPAPVSFQARQQLLQQNNGQPLRRNQVEQLRSRQPDAVVARPAVRAIGGVPGAAPGGEQQARPARQGGGQPATQPSFQQAPQAGQPAPQRPLTPQGRELIPPPAQAPAPAAAPANQDRLGRFPDRMNSRPSGAQPAPQVAPQSAPQAAPQPTRQPAPEIQSQPARPAPTMRPVPERAAPAPEARPAAPPRPERQVERPAERPAPQPAVQPVPAPAKEEPAKQSRPVPRMRPVPQDEKKQDEKK